MLLLLPSGICQGFSIVALPYWLSGAGMPVDEISTVVALSLLPYSWKSLLAPLADLGHRRQTWYLQRLTEKGHYAVVKNIAQGAELLVQKHWAVLLTSDETVGQPPKNLRRLGEDYEQQYIAEWLDCSWT